MKHQTPDSMKFKKLQRLLGVSRIVTIGTLELLWISTQKNAPQGDIGRFSNLEIAIECEWEGDPDVLVDSLIESGWLNECEVHRLCIHDWEQHAPGWVIRQLKRHGKSFVTASSVKSVTNDVLETTNVSPSVTDDQLEATPNLTQPNLTQSFLSSDDDPTEPDDEIPRDPKEAFDLIRSIKGIPTPAKLTSERTSKLRTRLRDRSWARSLALARDKLPVPGDGWQPDIDWLIANDSNVVKLLEGKYDWRGKTDPEPRSNYKRLD